jgi:hypothetical protein
MFQFAKILLCSGSLRHYLVVLRLPWSLLTVPLMLVSWIHLSERPAADSGPQAVLRPLPPGQIRTTSRTAGVAVLGVVPVSADEDDEVLSSTANDDDLPEPAGAPDADERARKKLLGKWEDDYQGKRYLTVAEDGTGKMVVELDGIGKRLFAERLTFDIEWSSADGRVTLKTLGGEPKSKVQVVLKLYGSEAEYRILELTDDRLLLLDADGKTKYDWRRPGATRQD